MVDSEMLKKRLFSLFSLLLCASLTAGLAGCASGPAASSSEESAATPASSAASSAAPSQQEADPSALPLVTEPTTLTYFHYLDGKVSASMSSHDEIGCYQEMEKRTGVHIEWLHPPVGQETEQFNLMIASQDLPDMIFWNKWKNVAGGVYGMIENEIILPLNELAEKNAPDYLEVIGRNDTISRQARLDDGTIFCFMQIDSEGHRANAGGIQLREDWLEKLNLSIPNNIDEFEQVLTAFKTQDPNGNGQADELPWAGTIAELRNLTSVYGVYYGMTVQDGKVVYGPATPAYKDYLARMSSWYAQGLIDPEYVVTDDTSKKAKVTGDLAGAYWGILSADLGTYMQAKADDPSFKLNGIPYLESADGSGKRYVKLRDYCGGSGTAVTTACKDPELATRWLNYAYSEEGHMLMVFGIEGESYEMVNDFPTMTETIMHNPDGLAFAQALARYACGSMSGAFEKDQRHFEQAISAVPEQIECLHRWQEGNVSTDIFLPPITMTADESSTYASIMTEVTAYADEMHDKFIMGKEPLDNFDSYVEAIGRLGIDQAIAAQQAAYDRYMQA
ncbi:MAG: extracellular solute-binding protein [Provencibacterium sp.]|nr:extracellular solute-binding protein [Provencibacterium sp.]